MKRFLSMLLALTLALSLGVTAGAVTGPEQVSTGWREAISANSWEALRLTNVERAKEGLQPLSTFEGLHAAAQIRAREIGQVFDHTRPNGQPDFALDQQCSREEALTMLLRLLGREREISQSDAAAHPFQDVSGWASPYVGFAFRNGIAHGTGATSFSGTNATTVSQELTFLLRALGYQSGEDFDWAAPWSLSDQVGLTEGQYNAGHQDAAISRGDMVLLCQAALDCKLAGKTITLRQDLEARGVI